MIKKVLFSILVIFSVAYLHSQENPESSLGQSPGENILFFGDQEESSEETSKCCWDDCAEVTLSLTYSSKYVWRGLNLVDESVLQPEFSASKCGFNLAVWGNMDATNVNGHSWEYSEINVIFDYSNTLDCCRFNLNYSIGAIHYIFPSLCDPSTWEFFLGLELDTCLNPAVVVYYDIDEVKGWYMTYGISHLWEKMLCPCKDFVVGLNLAASIGWGSSRYNDFYYSYDCTSFLDLLFTVSLPTTWRCWDIEPFFSASYLTNKSIRHRVYPDANYWGGITLSRTF
ncbi:MAG: TorF family putative porin [Chlamydiota bacterium]